jgi:hypothetical protein
MYVKRFLEEKSKKMPLIEQSWLAKLDQGMEMQFQNEFNFQFSGTEAGYSQWVVVRKLAAEAAAEKLNLPIGHEVEVWLRGGIRLKGKLRLLKDLLFVEEAEVRTLTLVLEGVTFNYSEIESCVRFD